MNTPRHIGHLYFMWRVALLQGNELEAEWIQQEATSRVESASKEWES